MLSKPLMFCGHTAQGYRKLDDNTFISCCVICSVTTQVKAKDKPDLTHRQAVCCGAKSLRPSSYDLAFFEYRGPGSPRAMDQCKCGYTKAAHDKDDNDHVLRRCAEVNGTAIFTARGPFKHDQYYCGCRGWD